MTDCCDEGASLRYIRDDYAERLFDHNVSDLEYAIFLRASEAWRDYEASCPRKG